MDRIVARGGYEDIRPLAVAGGASVARRNAHRLALIVNADCSSVIRFRQLRPTICSYSFQPTKAFSAAWNM